MIAHEGIEENLRFLLLEVRKQLEKTRACLAGPSERLRNSILARDDYIDQLKGVIQRKCFAQAGQATATPPLETAWLAAAESIAVNLERIADFCERVVSQLPYLEELEALEDWDYVTWFAHVIDAVSAIDPALKSGDTRLATRICEAEQTLDRLYAKQLRRILERLKRHDGDVQNLITVLFMARYLERMGDSLLNIGEALLSVTLGDHLKIHQVDALQRSVGDLDDSPLVDDLEVRAVGESRSGCHIARVTDSTASDGTPPLIFKEGRLKKVAEEKEGIERWNALIPGLAPEVLAYTSAGDSGAILLEFLSGVTFEQLLLRPGRDDGGLKHGYGMQLAFECLCRTLRDVWQQTYERAPVRASFCGQMTARLDEVYALHPRFRDQERRIGGLRVPSFEHLLSEVAALEEDLVAPFSVLIHGDFNVDNVIYVAEQDRIRFIDLHRSRLMDYAQDVSVFVVSNWRLRVVEPAVRRRIQWTVAHFVTFAREFAREMGDETFDVRLALGLARSLATSARFVLDNRFAKHLFLRSRYILEHVLAWAPRPWSEFSLPPEIFLEGE